MLEQELHKLKSHVTDTVEVRQELQTVKIATNCASKASMVVEQLENQLKLGNLEASVQGFAEPRLVRGHTAQPGSETVQPHLHLKLLNSGV